MAMPITTFFIGLLAMAQVPLTIFVGLRRARTKVSFLAEGDAALLRRMRAHGNFTETVPITLIAMAAAEMSGCPPLALWLGGACLVLGRALHAHILITKGWGITRAIGMILTMAAMFGFGLWDLSRLLVT